MTGSSTARQSSEPLSAASRAVTNAALLSRQEHSDSAPDTRSLAGPVRREPDLAAPRLRAGKGMKTTLCAPLRDRSCILLSVLFQHDGTCGQEVGGWVLNSSHLLGIPLSYRPSSQSSVCAPGAHVSPRTCGTSRRRPHWGSHVSQTPGETSEGMGGSVTSSEGPWGPVSGPGQAAGRSWRSHGAQETLVRRRPGPQ